MIVIVKNVGEVGKSHIVKSYMHPDHRKGYLELARTAGHVDALATLSSMQQEIAGYAALVKRLHTRIKRLEKKLEDKT